MRCSCVSHRVCASPSSPHCVSQMAMDRPERSYVVTSPISARCSSIFMTNDSPTLIVKKWEFQGDIRDHVCIKQAVHGGSV
jgi:hypothetical protein